MKIVLASAYDYDLFAKRSDESGLACPKTEGRAKQSFKEECDINTIVHRFGLSGQLPEGVRIPMYGDFTGIGDFHSAANAMAIANEAFDAMPAAVRTRFHNDPGEFVDFCLDEKNRDEARKLGLLDPQELAKLEAKKAAEVAAAAVAAAPKAPAVAAPGAASAAS